MNIICELIWQIKHTFSLFSVYSLPYAGLFSAAFRTLFRILQIKFSVRVFFIKLGFDAPHQNRGKSVIKRKVPVVNKNLWQKG